MRCVLLNLAFDAAVHDPGALLDKYHTLTGLSAALAQAGADVAVVQRFLQTTVVDRDGVRYTFASDGGPEIPSPSWADDAVVSALVTEQPDVVHINGLMFPAMVGKVKTALPNVPIVLQDHAGLSPPSAIRRLRDRSWSGLRDAHAWSFTAAEHSKPWRDAGLIGSARVFEIVESSTSFRPTLRGPAVERTGVSGSPAMLWVGRLNDNKDPLCVVRGFAGVLSSIPHARLWMIYSEATLEPKVRALIDSLGLRDRVFLVGHIAHERMPEYYGAADIFVSGSHREGSGYALIEAMGCGVVPVVTDIPSFRAIAGDCGRRWTVGSHQSLREALRALLPSTLEEAREHVRARFEERLSWSAIGRQTVDAYRLLL